MLFPLQSTKRINLQQKLTSRSTKIQLQLFKKSKKQKEEAMFQGIEHWQNIQKTCSSIKHPQLPRHNRLLQINSLQVNRKKDITTMLVKPQNNFLIFSCQKQKNGSRILYNFNKRRNKSQQKSEKNRPKSSITASSPRTFSNLNKELRMKKRDSFAEFQEWDFEKQQQLFELF